MRVIYTKGAREDLNAIVSYLERNYPAVISRFEACLEIVINELVIGPRARKKSQRGLASAACRSFATLTRSSIK